VQASHFIEIVRSPKTIKTQNIYQDFFPLVDPVNTTKVYKNEVLKTYEIDIYSTGDNVSFKAHNSRVTVIFF